MLWQLPLVYAQHFNFKNFTTKNGLANSIVLKITQDNEGYIWLATQGGLSRFDGKNYLKTTIRLMVSLQVTLAVY